MSDFGDYHNNPLWSDITHLDHLSPQPEFSYSFNDASGRWEPDLSNKYLYGISGLIVETNNWLEGVSGEIHDFRVDTNERLDHNNWLLTGISGEINQSAWENNVRLSGISGLIVESNTWLQSISGEIDESNLWLKGISGVLSNEIKIGVDLDHDTETHRLLSGVSGQLDSIKGETSDVETHRLLSGVSGELAELNVDIDVGDININRRETQPWKLVTRSVNQHIEEEFILLENIPEHARVGEYSGTCYGTDIDLMDDIYGTYHTNARRNISTPETGHPAYFLFKEDIDTGRCVQSKYTFHTDCEHGLRHEFDGSSINAHPLKDYPDLYQSGFVDHVTIINNSIYPLQVHTPKEPPEPFYLQDNEKVKIHTDLASKIHVKRSHTISGYTVNYSITYKATGETDVIS